MSYSLLPITVNLPSYVDLVHQMQNQPVSYDNYTLTVCYVCYDTEFVCFMQPVSYFKMSHFCLDYMSTIHLPCYVCYSITNAELFALACKLS